MECEDKEIQMYEFSLVGIPEKIKSLRRWPLYRCYNMTRKILTILGGIGIGLLGTEIIWQLWNKIWHNAKLTSIEKETINEVLIFSDECINCRRHANTRVPCSNKCPVASISRLIHYIESSSKTLDVCMYIMTCQDVTKAIIKAQQRNVTVRVIVDATMFENGACYDQLMQMKCNGVRVRMRRSTISLMHHKFAIIDGKIMIYGSTNWTMQAFYGNFDGILVTNQRAFVSPFYDEFNRMWKKYYDMNFKKTYICGTCDCVGSLKLNICLGVCVCGSFINTSVMHFLLISTPHP